MKKKEIEIIDAYLKAIENAPVCFHTEITIEEKDCPLVVCPYLRGKNGLSGHGESDNHEEKDDKGQSDNQVNIMA